MSAEEKALNGELCEIHFKDGLPGFASLKRFRLTEDDANAPFGTLQSLDQSDIQFIVVDPFTFYPEYEFDLPKNALGELHVQEARQLRIVSIVSFRSEEADSASINLVAPIVINRVNGEGRQIILADPRYSTRHRLFEASANARGGT